jgi:AAA+ superfamily predicted ATPase
VFDRYRNLLRKSERVPILLFNEADGLIGKRIVLSGGSANSTIAMMENTVQNIILDEFENFAGILIATTNLTGNMDDAFERRFLYKAELKKPGLEVRKSIWRSVMSELPEETIHDLALEHDLSGAQIQNVVRKSVINYAVTGIDASLFSLKSLCYEEQSTKIVKKSVGFVA